MIGAFADFMLWSLRNRLRSQLRRLRQPRYLIGAIVGVAWLGSLLLRGGPRGASPGPHVATPFEAAASHAELTSFVAALALCAVASLISFGAFSRPIEFSRAEVQWLFPAPITRRQLVTYKLARSQLGLLFSALVVTLLLRPGTLRDGWMFAAGFWIATTALRLHAIGVGFARASLSQHGLTGLRRQWPLLAVTLALIGILGLTAAGDAARLAALSTKIEVLEELRRIWSSGAARVVLWPFVTLASLPLAGSPGAFVAGLPGALGLVFLAYVRVVRADVAFEEAAAERAGKQVAAMNGMPAGKRRAPRGRSAPFQLALSGRPEPAIFWKNLIATGRALTPRALLLVLLWVVPLVAITGASSRRGLAMGLAVLCMTLAAMTVLMGPLVMRADLRRDLGLLGVLKAWPVSGTALLRGELLAPTILLAIAAWTLTLAAALLLGLGPVRGKLAAVLTDRAALTAAAMLVAPAIIAVQLLVQNALAVLFPAWITAGRTRDAGIEAMGQGMVTMLGGALLSALLLVAPAVGALVARRGAELALGTRTPVLPAAVLAALVFGEVVLLTRWLGRVVDRTDLGAIDPVES